MDMRKLTKRLLVEILDVTEDLLFDAKKEVESSILSAHWFICYDLKNFTKKSTSNDPWEILNSFIEKCLYGYANYNDFQDYINWLYRFQRNMHDRYK